MDHAAIRTMLGEIGLTARFNSSFGRPGNKDIKPIVGTIWIHLGGLSLRSSEISEDNMSKDEDVLFREWGIDQAGSEHWFDVEWTDKDKSFAKVAFLAGRATLADEIEKLREQIEEVIEGMHYTDSRSAAKLQNILYGPPQIAAIESESSPDITSREMTLEEREADEKFFQDQIFSPDAVKDEPKVGEMVRGTMNGEDWFDGELVEIIDLFAPYCVKLESGVRKYFAHVERTGKRTEGK